MCDPVIGAVIGGGQAALGVIGQNKALAARNRNRARLFEYDKVRIHGEHLSNITSYYLRGADAELSWDENMIAASQKVDEQQVIVNQKIAQSLRQTESDYVKMISDPRIAKSLARSGKSARRVASAFKAAEGRAKAARAGDMDDQVDRSLGVLEGIANWRRRADREATMKIGMQPQRAPDPPKPVFEKGPSLFSSLMKVAVGAAQGYLMGQDLKDAGFLQGKGGGLVAKKAASSAATETAKHAAAANTQWISTGAGQGFWHTVPQNILSTSVTAQTPLTASSALTTTGILSANALAEIDYYTRTAYRPENPIEDTSSWAGSK